MNLEGLPKYVTFFQSHLPITEIFRFCLTVCLLNMFQPSTRSSAGTKKIKLLKVFGDSRNESSN